MWHKAACGVVPQRFINKRERRFVRGKNVYVGVRSIIFTYEFARRTDEHDRVFVRNFIENYSWLRHDNAIEQLEFAQFFSDESRTYASNCALDDEF